MTWMMYDVEKIEVLVHDVRMQLVNVFRWVCLGGWLREVGAIQGSVFSRLEVTVADGCAGLQLFSFLSGWSPHA